MQSKTLIRQKQYTMKHYQGAMWQAVMAIAVAALQTIAVATLLTACSNSDSAKENLLKVNQVGYYPHAEKVAVMDGYSAAEVRLMDDNGHTVWTGAPVREATSEWSGKTRAIIDFSEVEQPGTYTLQAGEYKQTIVIKEHAYDELVKASMRAFYLQRSGVAIEEEYAGMYARPMGHPDTMVFVHEAAASENRPAGTVLSSPYGWYDAGDYNKYIVNSAFAIGEMLIAYEQNLDYFNTIDLNIPESGNDVPDFLDEIYFNLKWMLTMQDEDGGVYHKLTEPAFESFIKPTDCKKPRYVTQKGTAATLDFAAVMAMASRIYAKYPEYAEFAVQALDCAKSAYWWADANPDVAYDQPANNERYELAITTGAYDDTDFKDEFFWAETELYFATGNTDYMQNARKNAPEGFALPTWGEVSGLGMYEWIIQSMGFTESEVGLGDMPWAEEMLASMTSLLDERLAEVPTSCFQAPYGNRESDFGWGCNGEFLAGQGATMLLAYQLTGNEKYLAGAMQDADYLLGRNATGYCYVTGFGSKQVMHPHHRLSASDDIEAPLPGFLAGGPNPKQQDLEEVPGGYASDYADESYEDKTPSYASNEIAINWNAYLVALVWGIDALK